VIVECMGACTVVLQHRFSVPVLDIDAAQGGAIAAARGLARAVGWGFRTLVRTIKTVDATDAER